MKCPECYQDLGVETGRDSYAHILSCMHLEDKGVAQLRNENRIETEPRKSRIDAVLDYADAVGHPF